MEVNDGVRLKVKFPLRGPSGYAIVGAGAVYAPIGDSSYAVVITPPFSSFLMGGVKGTIVVGGAVYDVVRLSRPALFSEELLEFYHRTSALLRLFFLGCVGSVV